MVDPIVTKIHPFVENIILQMNKEQLISYDAIGCISGDGTPFEILNGFFKRQDIDFKKLKLNLFQIPGGSGCCLIDNAICLPYKFKNDIQTSIYFLNKFKMKEMNLMDVTALS